MKIVQVSPYDYMHPGGVNQHIFSLGEHLTRMGHEVKYILPSSRSKEHPKSGNIVFIGRPIPIHASGSIVRCPVSPYLLFSDRICETLELEKFDIVHLHEPLFPPLTTACLRYSCSTNIGTFHAYRPGSWGYWFGRRVLNHWVSKLNGRIAVSQPALDFISRYFPGDYTIIPNGIELERFATPAKPIEEFRDGKINILFVGRLEKRKGFGHLLQAFRYVKKENPNTRLIVVGPPGWSRWKYELLVRMYQLEDVVFVGYVSAEDLPRYYHTADVFCAPATGSESFGIVLLEAMAASKPIVASNIGGYASVISRDIDGLLVNPRDAKTLAGALDLLINDQPLRERLGAHGRLKAEEYGWDKIAHRVMDYYERVIGD
ncbi:MAG: glycosyltransferase family 4 protein [Dehalococcoidia bacterium]|nr:Phosphatidyl-myo-inositol mannosyltransferase [Chloroflexota bacterium]